MTTDPRGLLLPHPQKQAKTRGCVVIYTINHKKYSVCISEGKKIHITFFCLRVKKYTKGLGFFLFRQNKKKYTKGLGFFLFRQNKKKYIPRVEDFFYCSKIKIFENIFIREVFIGKKNNIHYNGAHVNTTTNTREVQHE